MTKLSGPISAGIEPIPGYTLRRRLGAGGFGEVWLADAPGGLQKAIKLVYGTVDQERASSELRSLQRIRQVHHPFLLSLERIEVVNQQIVIVTELAECSLVERFQQYRGKGLPGIPRDLLIDFMRDTADALDFLSQKHELQHLDIKPGNLLIVADRIKVGDFGLVKDLHEQNQSLIGGLTPTYAAPEIFDGRPDHRSDQYSLAIVYQELLTGQMPFTGRTTAELARQHLNQPPNLESLPPADRQIIARALAKNPLDRFSSCRQLIDQLSRVRAVVAPMPSGGENEEAATLSPNSEPSTSTSIGGRQRVLPPLDFESTSHSWVPSRCLFIGLGGMGCSTLAKLYQTIGNDPDSAREVNDHEWLAIDTDSHSLDAITTEEAVESLPAAFATQIKLFKPQEYREAHPQLFRAISRRWLYNIPRSLQTEGVRPLGMLAFLDHYEQLTRALHTKLSAMIKDSNEDRSRSTEPLRVYIVSSAHGGTGSAIFMEIGYLVRDILRQLNWHNYRICGSLSLATTLSANHSEMASAAALACCSELVHCMDNDAMVPPVHYLNNQTLYNPQRPFDWVSIFDGGVYGSEPESTAANNSMAEAIWLDSHTLAGSALSSTRISTGSVKLAWLRTLQTTNLRHATSINAARLSRLCCNESIAKALAYILGPSALIPSSASVANSHSGATCSGEMPLTANAADDILKRVLVQLHCLIDPSVGEDALLCTWAQRLSVDQSQIESQHTADLSLLLTWLNGLVQARILNWKQIEKLQLALIERIMDFASPEGSDLIGYLAQFDFPGTTSEVTARARAYLNRIAKTCLNLVQQFKDRGRELGRKLKNWHESLLAEHSLATEEFVYFESLTGEWAQVAARVVAVLESTFQRMTIQILDAAFNPPAVAPLADSDSINLQYLLSLSRDLCDRFARDFHISLDTSAVADESTTQNNGICFKQLEEFLPTLSVSGGDVHRLLIVPQDQLHSVAEAINKCGLTEATTLLPSSLSRRAYVFTDATNLNFSRLVGSLWRPNHKTFQLAERLLTRVDIEWPSVGKLLSINETSSPAAQSPVVPILNDLDYKDTQQIGVV